MPTKSQIESRKKSTNQTSNAVVWVEVPVTDMERAKKFYSGLFGFHYQMNQFEGYNMAMFNATPEKYGCGGALMEGETYEPSHLGPTVYFETPDIEGTLKKAAQTGGKVIQGKKSIGEHGFIAFLEDSEGNRIALHHMS